MTETKKSQVAYYRKLYLAYLIDTKKHNLVSLEETTEMPKPTIKTAMQGFPNIGIQCNFVRPKGLRNGQGYFEITDWGDHSKSWIKANMALILEVLE